MAVYSQPYRITWPLNSKQAKQIDQMFEMLFKSVRALALTDVAVEASVPGPMGQPGEDAEDTTIWPWPSASTGSSDIILDNERYIYGRTAAGNLVQIFGIDVNGDVTIGRGNLNSVDNNDGRVISIAGTGKEFRWLNASATILAFLQESTGRFSVGVATGAGTAKLQSRATTEQLRLDYDASNYVSFTVASVGSLTIAPTGTNPSITLTPAGTGITNISSGSASIGAGTSPNAKLDVLSTTEQLRLDYDASNYNSFTVGSTGTLTIAATGTNPDIVLTPGGTGAVKPYAYQTFAWTSVSLDTVYQASTDGFVVMSVTILPSSPNDAVYSGLTDSSNPPITTRCVIGGVVAAAIANFTSVSSSMTMPVKKGDYFKIVTTNSGGTTYGPWWVPLGTVG